MTNFNQTSVFVYVTLSNNVVLQMLVCPVLGSVEKLGNRRTISLL